MSAALLEVPSSHTSKEEKMMLLVFEKSVTAIHNKIDDTNIILLSYF
jgi:hypothetical protein